MCAGHDMQVSLTCGFCVFGLQLGPIERKLSLRYFSAVDVQLPRLRKQVCEIEADRHGSRSHDQNEY
jgi:hypothetical protein